MCSIDSTTGNGVGIMSRSSGDNEPAHYMLKVEAFSLLSEAGIHTFESDTFQSGEYKWKMVLYPNGNKTDEGENHISLYLRIVDTERLPKDWEVNVYFKFYVYDHVREDYLTVQEVKKRRFCSMKLEWGFAKLIPHKIFKDTSSGYLFQDSCVFGVEVFVTPKFVLKENCLSMIKLPSSNNSYTWNIDKFSSVQEDYIFSEDFKVGKIKWKLQLFPKGNKTGSGTHLSLYLVVADNKSLPIDWRIYAKYKMRVRNQAGIDHQVEQELDHWFCAEEKDWGFSSFISLSDLKDVVKCNLVKDKLILEIEFSVIGVVKSLN